MSYSRVSHTRTTFGNFSLLFCQLLSQKLSVSYVRLTLDTTGPLKKRKNGAVTRRQGLVPIHAAQPRLGILICQTFLHNWNANVPLRQRQPTALQPLTVKGDQTINEKQQPLVLRAQSLMGVKIFWWSPDQVLLICIIDISVPFCIKLTFMSFVFLDDYASSSGVLVSRLNAKLESNEVRFLFFQKSPTYTNKLKFRYTFWSLVKHWYCMSNISLSILYWSFPASYY